MKRRKWTSKEKLMIVIEGMKSSPSLAEHCNRYAIARHNITSGVIVFFRTACVGVYTLPSGNPYWPASPAYNTDYPHSAIGYLTPQQYEKHHQKTHTPPPNQPKKLTNFPLA